MYIRSKIIKGHRYFYLVQGTRDGRTVRQIVLRYLGKNPGPHNLYPVAFKQIVTGWYQREFEHIFYRLGVTSITYDGPDQVPADGCGQTSMTELRFRRDATRYEMAHQLGHLLYRLVPEAVTRPAMETHADTLRSLTETLHDEYGLPKGQQPPEQFANLVAASLTLPVADRTDAQDWLLQTLYRIPHLQAALSERRLWVECPPFDADPARDQRPERVRHNIEPSGSNSIPVSHQNSDFGHDTPPERDRVALYRMADPAPPDETRPQPAQRDASDSRRRARQVKGDKIKQLTERALHDLAAALQAGQSEAMVAYLQTMATFHTYSFGNTLLIAAQRPAASRVAGFRTWKKWGRSVRKGERGLLIYAPVRSKAAAKRTEDADGNAPSPAPDEPPETEITGFRPVYVFDVAQTEGAALPDAPRVQGDPGERLRQLEQFTAQRDIRLVYTEDLRPGVDGVSSGGLIRLRRGLPPAEAFGVLVHELAHEQLHHGDASTPRPPKTVVETEAEAVAHVVSAAIGLDVGTASSDYIQLYQGSTDTLAASLQRIQRTASDILKGLLAEPE